MPHQSRPIEQYRIILQQDAPEPVIQQWGPVTPEGLLRASVGQLTGYPIDVYASDANHAGGVHYHSQVAGRCLGGRDRLRSGTALQMQRGAQQLVDQGTDPLKIYCEGAHAHGLDYMVRLRMNDLHDMVGFRGQIDRPHRSPRLHPPEAYYYTSTWRAEHGELLLGDPHDATPEGSYAYWERGAPNYALGPVRRYIFDIAEELLNHCDLDALEMDFIRSPFFFSRPERYAQRHVMTGLVQKIAEAARQAGRRRGRPVRLSARVPDSLELAQRTGLDMGRWLELGLLDMVTIGGGYNPFGVDWRDIAAAARRAGVPALACLNHGMFNKDPNRIRAAAYRADQHGASGFELWNFFYCMDSYHPPGRNPLSLAFTEDLADPTRLATLPKTYPAAQSFDPTGYVGSAYEHVTAPGQAPMTIGQADDGIGHVVEFDIADDPAASGPDASWRLGATFVDLGPSDQLAFAWNGHPIEPASDAWPGPVHSGRHQRAFSLTPAHCRRGLNQLEVRLLHRDPMLDPFVTLSEAHVDVPGGA